MTRNAITWFEIPTTALDRAQAFYEAVLGRPMQREHMETSDMAIFAYDPQQGVGGAITQGPLTTTASHNGTVVYLDASPSLQAALDRATAQGGSVVVPAQALPGDMGHFAHILDLDGNRVGLHAAL